MEHSAYSFFSLGLASPSRRQRRAFGQRFTFDGDAVHQPAAALARGLADFAGLCKRANAAGERCRPVIVLVGIGYSCRDGLRSREDVILPIESAFYASIFAKHFRFKCRSSLQLGENTLPRKPVTNCNI